MAAMQFSREEVVVVDKEGLERAVKLRNQATSVNFASVKQILPEEMALNSIKLKKLGDIQIPVSLLVRFLTLLFYKQFQMFSY